MGKLFEAVKDMGIDGRRLAVIAANEVNCMIQNRNLVAEMQSDPDVWQAFMKMSLSYVMSLATLNSYEFLHDGRNEQACMTAAALAEYPGLHSYFEKTGWDGAVRYTVPTMKTWAALHDGNMPGREGEFAYWMSNEHRTLQQSFAGHAFTAVSVMLERDGDQNVNRYMEEKLGYPDWTRMPMI